MRHTTLGRSIAAALLSVGLVLAGASAPAAAHPGPPRTAERLLIDFWKTVLSKTPAEALPTICARYDGVLTPFILDLTVNRVECRARAGQLIFVTGYAFEYSAAESVRDGKPNWTPESLRAAAIEGAGGTPPLVTYDGRPLRQSRVVTRLATARLPEDDLIGTNDRKTVFVGAAWAGAVIARPGRHTILITNDKGEVFTTILDVRC